MPRVTVAAFTPPSGDDLPLPLAPGAAKVPFVAADIVNNHRLPLTGREVLLIRNGDAAPQVVTITSAPDEEGRSGDITGYNIPAGETHCFGPFPLEGWAQGGDGNALWFQCATVTMQVAALRLPAMV